ncbi:YneF family protein [Streptococcus cameli]
MNTTLIVLLVIVALLGGVALGMFIARKQVEKMIADKPVLDENALRVMMTQMGQKPSEAKVQQAYRQIKAQQKQAAKKK